MLERKEYIRSVNAKGIFDNTFETKIPQTVVRQVILRHFEASDKKPKCLFIGWDGCRADAMKYLIQSDDKKVSGSNITGLFSAIAEVKKSGGLYITYVGGDKSNLQETSTAQGWASALCGKWMKKPWKTGMEWSLDEEYPTVLKTLALKGFTASFSAIWPTHFDYTYKNEIDCAGQNNLNEYFCQLHNDPEVFDSLKERIALGDDLIFGIFENPDDNGHGTDFGDGNYRYVAGVCNLDRISYQLLESVKKRETYAEEDWLIVLASDHGGHSTRHGGHSVQDTTTFLALSKPIEELIK
ncbi:MAG: alkaline phosphatase family protein [Acutalibacteraceae bacterium]